MLVQMTKISQTYEGSKTTINLFVYMHVNCYSVATGILQFMIYYYYCCCHHCHSLRRCCCCFQLEQPVLLLLLFWYSAICLLLLPPLFQYGAACHRCRCFSLMQLCCVTAANCSISIYTVIVGNVIVQGLM